MVSSMLHLSSMKLNVLRRMLYETTNYSFFWKKQRLTGLVNKLKKSILLKIDLVPNSTEELRGLFKLYKESINHTLNRQQTTESHFFLNILVYIISHPVTQKWNAVILICIALQLILA